MSDAGVDAGSGDGGPGTDGGVGYDAGPGADAGGVFDAGTLNDAGVIVTEDGGLLLPDGGSARGTFAVGCGCQSGGPSVTWLVLLAPFLRRRRTVRSQARASSAPTS
jgi:uncharacterized protein (TIGR03382 family)